MQAYLFDDQDEIGVMINPPLDMSKVLKEKMVVLSDSCGDFILLIGNDYTTHSALIADYLKQVHRVEVQRYFQNYSEETEMREKLGKLGLTSMGGMDIDSMPARHSPDNIASTRITGGSNLLGKIKLETLERIVPHIFADPDVALSWERMKAEED
jgi:hypothetical protein